MSNVKNGRFEKNSIIKINFLVFVLAQTSVDLYLPSLPSMVKAFHSSEIMIQSTLTVYFIGYAIAPLFLGPLCDQLGRRSIRLISLSIALLASVGCSLTDNIYAFLLYRLLQGIGMAGCVVSGRAVLRDLYQGDQLAKIIAFFSMLWSLVPILAPIVGGYIQHYFNWRMNFHVLLIFTALVFWLNWKLVPETLQNTVRSHFSFSEMFKHYKIVLKNRQFIIFTSCITAMSIIPASYSVSSSFLLENQLGITPHVYGWCTMLVGSSLLLGNFISRLLMSKFNQIQLIKTGQMFSLISAIIFLITTLISFNIVSFILPLCFLILSTSILYPVLNAAAMSIFNNQIASAGALLTTLQVAGWGIGSATTSLFTPTNAIPIASICFIATGIIIGLLIYWQHYHEK